MNRVLLLLASVLLIQGSIKAFRSPLMGGIGGATAGVILGAIHYHQAKKSYNNNPISSLIKKKKKPLLISYILAYTVPLTVIGAIAGYYNFFLTHKKLALPHLPSSESESEILDPHTPPFSPQSSPATSRRSSPQSPPPVSPKSSPKKPKHKDESDDEQRLLFADVLSDEELVSFVNPQSFSDSSIQH